MNRCWYFPVFCFLILGCHGQQTKTPTEKEQGFNDSVAAIANNAEILHEPQSKETAGNLVEVKDTFLAEQIKRKEHIPKVLKKPKSKQTELANIWTEEQITFLNQVEKILLFIVEVTDIGSRKLELNSQLNQTEHRAFIAVLLDSESYPDTAMTEANSGKKFEPNYQMLLEAGEEKLTLMFDVEGLNMMVANLYGREKYAISPALIQQVENLRKRQ